MTVKELIEDLSQYPEDAEIVSIEVDNWQDLIETNEWRLKVERLFANTRDANIIILNPK